MTIVHVTNYQVPGYGYEEIMLARAQHRLNQNAIIVASNYLHPRGFYAVLRERFPQRRVERSEQTVDGVRIIRLTGIEIGQRVWIRGLERQIRRLKPDVVHCHNLMQFHPLRLAWLKARTQMNFALIVDDHMHFSVMRRNPMGRIAYFLFRNLARPLLEKKVDRFCAIGDDTKRYLERACGIRAPIDVMPLGVDTDVFRTSMERRERARRALAVEARETVYLYTGKVIPAKGVHLLTKAALKLLGDGEQLRVIVVGDADRQYVERLMAEIRHSGNDKHFTFLPSRNQADLPDVYAAADVAVWPRQESMALYEALAMSIPVVISEASGYLPTLSGVASTFKADDADSLAETMKGLLSGARRQQLGSVGLRLAAQDYSWERSAERYLRLYATILDHGVA